MPGSVSQAALHCLPVRMTLNGPKHLSEKPSGWALRTCLAILPTTVQRKIYGRSFWRGHLGQHPGQRPPRFCHMRGRVKPNWNEEQRRLSEEPMPSREAAERELREDLEKRFLSYI